MAIDADLNGVIANVGNGVGHWKRMATRLARTLAKPQARSGTGRTECRAVATSGPKYRHDRTVTIQAMYRDGAQALADHIAAPVKNWDGYPEIPPQNYLDAETRLAVGNRSVVPVRGGSQGLPNGD